MSELRVDNIVSEDGSAAPIYSRGMNIGSGTTLTCDGNFVVGGATSIAGTVEVGGTFKANTLTPLTGNTVTIPSGRFLSVGGGVTVASGGNLDITGGFTVGGATTITGSVDVQGSLKSNTLTPLTGDTVTIPAGRYVNVGGGVTVTNAGTFTVSGPTSFQSGAVVTGVVTFTEADLQTSLTLTGLDVGSNIKLGNAGVITATSFVGDGTNLSNTGSTLSAGSGTQRVVLTGQTSGTMTASATNANLTFNSSNGTLSATTFSGNLTGNVTGNVTGSATGLSGSPNITVGTLNCGQVIATGNVTVGNGLNDTYLTMSDADQGARQLHNNSNYIGFLMQNGSWGSRCDDDGHWLPGANNTHDLGNSSFRWRNIYTNDLNLSNEGGANDVDGTWGSWTIQEGDEDLFLINRKNGKKYKFNLTEV